MSLAQNINAVNSFTSTKATRDSKLIPVTISPKDKVTKEDKKKRKTEKYLLRTQVKPKMVSTKEKLIASIRERYNAMSEKEKQEVKDLVNSILNKNPNKGSKKDSLDGIQNIMMIITKVWGKSLEIQGVDEMQQANDIKCWQSYLDAAQAALKDDFDKIKDLNGKSASGGNWKFWLPIIAIAVVVLLVAMPEIIGILAESAAEAAPEIGGEASAEITAEKTAETTAETAAKTAGESISKMDVTEDTEIESMEDNEATSGMKSLFKKPPEDIEMGNPVSEDGLPKAPEGASKVPEDAPEDAPKEAPKKAPKTWREKYKKVIESKPWRITGKALGGFAKAGMAFGLGYMGFKTIEPDNAPHEGDAPDQGKITQYATENQIVSNITNDMNNKVQMSSKRASDDSQNTQQDAGYIQQAINSLGISMQIKV